MGKKTIGILIISLIFLLSFYLIFTSLTRENHLKEGFRLYQRGSFKKAVEHLEKAVQAEPSQYKVHHLLARSYESLGQFDKALPEYLKASKINQKQPDVHYQLAIIYRNKRAFNKALYHLNKAINLKAEFIGARVMLAETLGDLNRNKEAIKEYLSLIKASYPSLDENSIHLALLKLYLKQNDKQKARNELAIVKKTNPDSIEVRELEAKLR